MKNFLLFCLLFSLALSACYYDNEEDLYPDDGEAVPCDTVEVSYQNTVLPLLQTHECIACHQGSSPNGNVGLDSHAKVQSVAESGALYGVIAHLPGFSEMPRDEPQMPACEIAQIKAWIDQGSLDN